jgi:hypothetical protein
MILQVFQQVCLDTGLSSASSEEAELKSPVLVEGANFIPETNGISSAYLAYVLLL